MKKTFITFILLFVFCSLVACQGRTQTVTPQGQDGGNSAINPNTVDPQVTDPDQVVDSEPDPEPVVYEYIDAESYNFAMDVAIPDSSDTDATILAAYQMYCIANRNDQNCLRRMSVSQCLVTTKAVGITANEAQKVVYEIKNGTEYLKYDFQPTIGAAKGFGKAIYANVDLPYSLYLNAGDSVITDWVGTADFSNLTEKRLATKVQNMCFHVSQEPTFQLTEAIILPETIKTASITHNDEEGYYIVKMTLDAKNETTTSILLPNLRAGSVMTSGANYTSFEETFEIWDNGFFKFFHSIDNWKTSLLKGKINYESTFSYSEEDCDFARYNNNSYEQIKAIAEQLNAERSNKK